MKHIPYYWRISKECARCGTVFVPNVHNAIYCSPECKQIVSTERFKNQNPDYWVKYSKLKKKQSTKRTPEMTLPYNYDECILCKQPLGKTANRYYHAHCHERVTNLYCHGLNQYTGVTL